MLKEARERIVAWIRNSQMTSDWNTYAAAEIEERMAKRVADDPLIARIDEYLRASGEQGGA